MCTNSAENAAMHFYTLQEVSRGHSIWCRNNTEEGLNLLI